MLIYVPIFKFANEYEARGRAVKYYTCSIDYVITYAYNTAKIYLINVVLFQKIATNKYSKNDLVLKSMP
jgi:hypothetical protein